ncbi:MAG TPA: redox-sensing transcriptional repressor Rex [Elusimicrobia bacterium]|nr:MAG: redox-sensing transcriptional repressor Rex [Elusimicrobia bacterium RIFOXYA12_FULL_49_49]OGS10252.1 MAG: redox-sensing transcriptional repressor Rex [Elusimicrobia bacterium RIFOXYA1_FULL_47_7]OGS15626.1 MAG: redox-sensing transcriptional repressor Rex [Elusimicrobia bacterium RIFOXYA2_FULL_47_53]OGS26818.1 MAG: redox-sensing transcriptional repressor Rex [Elusimicrobia bacterium RIFOXYB12_FULL_50_12]OGS30725.1 MAG: redox-sensing transcriptional repressor Rex [Elusimicrobia bacterium R
MNIKKADKIPSIVVPRLSRYYRILFELDSSPLISSKVLSEHTGFTAAQIRRDLAYFGQFGSPGRGYNVEELKKTIKNILGLDRAWNVCVIGTGNLGMALLGYNGFKDQGFEVVAAFDSDPEKIGKTVNGIKILSISEMAKVVREKNIQIGLLTVPGRVAQQAAENAVNSGIKSIMNFAPVHLKLPENVKVRHIDMTVEIERLSFMISRE